MRLPTPTRVYHSAGFYPITGLYLGGVILALAVSQGYLDFKSGIIVFAFFALIALLAATLRELKAVHLLVDGQRTELLSRIDELTALLVDANVNFPAPGTREQDARDDVRRTTPHATPEQDGDEAVAAEHDPKGPKI